VTFIFDFWTQIRLYPYHNASRSLCTKFGQINSVVLICHALRQRYDLNIMLTLSRWYHHHSWFSTFCHFQHFSAIIIVLTADLYMCFL